MNLREMLLAKHLIGSGGSGGSTDEWIGDGNTHIWITLHEGRTSPMLGVCPNGTVTVDWGDGTSPDVLTGTSLTTVKYTPNHEYAKAGNYVITLTVDGEIKFSTGQSSYLLQHSESGGNYSIVYSSAIQKVEIGGGVTSIDNYAFGSCYSLASIAIPESVTSIGNNAFNGCCSLASIAIPESVASIGNNAFNYCYSLASIAIPESVTYIGTYAFGSCYSLASIAILEGVTSIGNNAFNGCYSLTSIAIPEGVTSIGTYAFNNCCSLASIAIPESVASIGDSAFNYCNGVRYYDFSKHTKVPTLGGGAVFRNIPSDCEIRVPAALYDVWIAATNWTVYASNIVAV